MDTDAFSHIKPSGFAADGIEPARLQFIQSRFHDFLDAAARGRRFQGLEGGPRDLLQWIHDRLFIAGRPVGSIRSELTRCLYPVQILAVTSGKGGVGKTTISVNLALALARNGRRVLLFDADLGMANTHVFAGINPQATLLDVIEGRTTLPEIVCDGPGNLKVICGPSGVARLADLDTHTLESMGRELLKVSTGFDAVVIDTGAGIGAPVTHFLGLAQNAIVVSTPNLASALDAYGVIKVAHEAHLGTRMHVLVNQAQDLEESNSVRHRITGCATRFLGITLGDLGYLTRDTAFENSNQSRVPLLLSQPDNINATRLIEIANRLTGEEFAVETALETTTSDPHHAAA